MKAQVKDHLVLVCLVVAIFVFGSVFGVYVSSTGPPTAGTVVTAGGQDIPCTWDLYNDGTTPVAKAGTNDNSLGLYPGDVHVGSAGQDWGAFLTPLLASQAVLCFESQSFVFTSTLHVTYGMFLRGVSPGPAYGGSILVNAHNGTLLWLTHAYTTVSGFTVQGTGNPLYTADIGIQVSSANNVFIENVFFLSAYNDLQFDGTSFYETVSHCTWFSARNDMVYSPSTADVNIHFTDSYILSDSAVNGLELNGIDGITIDTFEASGYFAGTVLKLDHQKGGVTLISNSVFENTDNAGQAVWLVGSSGTKISYVFFDNVDFGGGMYPGATWLPAIEIDYGYEISFNGGNVGGVYRGIRIKNYIGASTVSGLTFQLTSPAIYTEATATLGSLTITDNHYNAGDYFVSHATIPSGNVTGAQIYTGNDVTGSTGFIYPTSAYFWIVNNAGYHVAPFSETAGSSVFTRTDTDGWPWQMEITTTAGISAFTCNGVSLATALYTLGPVIYPGQSCAITWSATAPHYTIYPAN